MPSETILRQGAAGAFQQSRESHQDAALLAVNGRYATAVALAILGIEEFAKSIVWTVAALLPDERSHLPARLDHHAVKHYVAMLSEVSLIETEDSEYELTAVDRVTHACWRLGETGLSKLLPPAPRPRLEPSGWISLGPSRGRRRHGRPHGRAQLPARRDDGGDARRPDPLPYPEAVSRRARAGDA